jgi:excisionase family DNA binding protein
MNFLTVEEFAQRMKMHPGTVRRAIKSGKVYASRVSPTGLKGPFRIAESELERLHLQGMYQPKKK